MKRRCLNCSAVTFEPAVIKNQERWDMWHVKGAFRMSTRLKIGVDLNILCRVLYIFISVGVCAVGQIYGASRGR
jgi:hypothetical protein